MQLAGKRVLVMGMARSGVATLRLLRAQQALPFACDSRPLDALGSLTADVRTLAESFLPQQEIEDRGIAGHGFGLVVLSPGVPADLPLLEAARAAGVPVIGEVELAVPFLQGPVIGITGTNGKTTTTALTGHLLRNADVPCQVGGNIGTPVCDLVASSQPDQWNVLELSSFQLETTTSLRAQIAVCLNITPDHLDRHHTFDNYIAAKRQLFTMQQPGAHAVLNADDPVVANFATATRATNQPFSVAGNPDAFMRLDDDQILWRDQPVLRRSDIPLPGLHNVENGMAATFAAMLAGARMDSLAHGVHTFPGVEHRIEFVRERAGVKWYNDSKATNVDAALKAIAAFQQPMWIILGGKDKNGDYRPLAEALKGKVRHALLIGQAAPIVESHIGAEIPCLPMQTIDNAVEHAARAASPGDVVLLAPACASFDQFENYEHRGRHFKRLVANLKEEVS